ncbi:MAG: polyprenyl diphosphate synthase [Acidiferrobacterales bacterium]|nr:polyprenyl diphosphate synthase [Acidiferrobacterales bacterium]
MPTQANHEPIDSVPEANLPEHVAIIMDGNGRWANSRGTNRLEGHRQGVKNVRTIVELCGRFGIPYLTLFAFSSENWRRPGKEVQWLMQLLSTALSSEVRKLHDEGIRLKFIGDLSDLSTAIQRKTREAMELTESNRNLQLTIAVNYGGQWDLTQACRDIADRVKHNELAVEDISPDTIAGQLSTAAIPNPDLFIRTGGEKRISNFLLWQLAYTELYFTDTYWPDFGEQAFLHALKSYGSRVRRFGGIVQASAEPAKQHA